MGYRPPMYKYALLLTALAACGSKGGGDDCQKAFDKMMPLVSKMAGKPISDDEKAKALGECRDNMTKKDAKDSDKALVKCVVAAEGDDAIKACMEAPMKDYQKRSKKTEAQLQLNKLMKNAKVAFINSATYPVGKAPLTPAAACCSGPDKHCPVDAAQWSKDPTWAALDFSVDEPNLYQYSYESDGKTVTATAVGDSTAMARPRRTRSR